MKKPRRRRRRKRRRGGEEGEEGEGEESFQLDKTVKVMDEATAAAHNKSSRQFLGWGGVTAKNTPLSTALPD